MHRSIFLLARELKRGDMADGVGGRAAEDVLTFDEWRRHKRFDEHGGKIEIEDPDESARKFVAKMSQIRQRLEHYAERGAACPTCKQALPTG